MDCDGNFECGWVLEQEIWTGCVFWLIKLGIISSLLVASKNDSSELGVQGLDIKLAKTSHYCSFIYFGP